MQNSWRLPGGLRGVFAHGGDTIAEDFDSTIPSRHDFGRFQAIVRDLMPAGMVQRLTDLARDVLYIPDGKALVTIQRSGHAVALNVFERCAEQPFHFSGTINHCDIGAVEGFRAVGFFEDAFY